MTGFLVRRLGQSVIVVVGVTIVTFVLTRLLPGGVARAVLGPRASPVSIAEFDHANGLDLPGWQQYLFYLNQVVHGNLGFSIQLNESVTALLSDHLPKTIILLGVATLLTLVIAVPLGVLQAVRRNKLDDYFFTTLSFALYSMPIFWLGLILIIIFSADLNVLPPEGPQGDISTYLNPDQFLSLVLPVVTLALVEIALFSRYMRSSMLDNLVLDYVRTAKAKGVSTTGVLYGHVLRNALIPIVTLLGLSLPGIFSGALIAEAIFNYPGMGLLFWDSAQKRDYPVLLGVTLVVAVATVVGNLLADIGYAVVDPRVRVTE
ncbi:MAG: ABC transporter permease [Candidatus Dormibacteraeota bacterium]|nr:ABC transporter permease [Candidatus Dormibacteraeota bacterium]